MSRRLLTLYHTRRYRQCSSFRGSVPGHISWCAAFGFRFWTVSLVFLFGVHSGSATKSRPGARGPRSLRYTRQTSCRNLVSDLCPRLSSFAKSAVPWGQCLGDPTCVCLRSACRGPRGPRHCWSTAAGAAGAWPEVNCKVFLFTPWPIPPMLL